MDINTIELLIARNENLPVLPQVVSAVFRMTENPQCSAADLERLIEDDSALTAKVLRVVNSAMFGVSTVTTTNRAVAVLGTERIKALVTSLALQSVVGEGGKTPRFKKLEFWRHSLATAMASQMLARRFDPLHVDEMFVAGLLHDVGLLLMDKHCPVQLDATIRDAEIEGLSMHQAESRTLPFTHARLGAILARRWRLGEFLTETIERHHEAIGPASSGESWAVLEVADALAHRAGFLNQLSFNQDSVSEELLLTLVASLGPMEQVTRLLQEGVANAETAFGITFARGRSAA